MWLSRTLPHLIMSERAEAAGKSVCHRCLRLDRSLRGVAESSARHVGGPRQQHEDITRRSLNRSVSDRPSAARTCAVNVPGGLPRARSDALSVRTFKRAPWLHSRGIRWSRCRAQALTWGESMDRNRNGPLDRKAPSSSQALCIGFQCEEGSVWGGGGGGG